MKKNDTKKDERAYDFDKVKQSLFKRASGFSLKEVVEEYSFDEGTGSERLTKRKVNLKEVPP